MMYYTHLAFGLLVSLISINIFNIKNEILFILIILFFSIFPDIDYTKSRIGKENKLLSKIINIIFGHRGLFHTIYIPLILFFIFYNINNELGIAILLGYFSHLFMDAINKKGIRLFYPLINKKINGFFKTGSFVEKILFFILIFVDLYIILIHI